MNTLEAIQQRRSVKQFVPEHTMDEESFRQLMSLAILSPTSFNIQNWRFLRICDPELRAAIRAVSWDQSQVTEASELLLLCADLHAWDKEPERYWQNAPDEVRDMLVSAIRPFYRDHEQIQRDEAMRSVGIVAQTLMLAARSLGYDSCPMIGFDPDSVAKLVDLPENHVIGMMLVIGKAAEPANPRGGQLSLDEVLFTDQFPGT